MYPTFKADILAAKAPVLTVQGITNPYGVECVTLVWAYANALWPDVSIKDTITIGNAAGLFANSNGAYFEKIANNHSDPNQVPLQGDVMVFGPTPQSGYSNTFPNPDGHCGICDSASPGGYALFQQNSPTTGARPNVTNYPWKYRPCVGWLRPKGSNPAPAPSPAPTAQTVTLPKDVSTWAVYKIGSLLRKGTTDQVGTLLPSVYGPLIYGVLSWAGNYAVNIDTQDFGPVTIWVRDTPAVIS
jgi:hypothetical protein